jgi:hypothetical protein
MENSSSFGEPGAKKHFEFISVMEGEAPNYYLECNMLLVAPVFQRLWFERDW